MRVREISRLVAAITLLLPVAAFAQGGIIAGTVRDSSSAAIPGAVVQSPNEATAATFQAVTDEQGAYQFVALAPGRYRLEAMLDGFETDVRQITVEEGRTVTIVVTLSPARITEGVVVTARRIEESAQEVPIPLSVVGGNLVSDAGAFNVNRLQEIVPTVQFYFNNP